MPSSPSRSDVITPVSRAWDHTLQLLFRPFDLGRWLAIGFTAWLATLGRSLGGGGGGGRWNASDGDNAGKAFADALDRARDWISENAVWFVPVVVIGGLVVLAVWLVFLWLSSRGQFMFLHNVVTGRDDVVEPWNRYSAHGHSLFIFRLVIALAALAVSLPFVGVVIWAGLTLVRESGSNPAAIVVAVVGGLALFVLGIGYFIVAKLTADFVVPIMWRRTPSCRTAWREFLGLASSNPGAILLYLLFQILLWMAAILMILAVVVMTCCLAGCLMALPYLGTVFLLPVLVFFRSYSLHFLAQFGPKWDLFLANDRNSIDPAPAQS